MTDVGIWLYELSKCGYFPFRGQNANPTFGGIVPTFDALTAWANGKFLGETSTFTPMDGDEGGGAYFLGIAKGSHDDFLVGIWNRLPGNKTNITSVGVGDVVGSASAEVTAIDHNRIPGFATYFWVMPGESRIATIRLKHDSHGLDNFRRYMLAFLKNVNPQNVVLGPPGPNGELVVAGYRASLSSGVAGGAFPKFAVKSIPLKGDIVYLQNNVGLIDKVFRKTTLTSESPQDWADWQKVMDLSKIFRTRPPLREEAEIRLEFPMTFTRAELDQAVQSWQEQGASDATNSDDVGFHVRGGKTYWLTKSQARLAYQIDVSWIDEELVDMNRLLQQLQVHRTAVLALG